MITKEKILEILEQNSILSRTAGRVVIYENDWENIAEEIVKNCSIPDVVKPLPQDTDGCSNDRDKCSCKDWGGCPVD